MLRSKSGIALIIIVVGLVVLLIADMTAGLRTSQGAGIVMLLALMVSIGGGALAHYRGRGGTALLHICIWLAIGLFIACAALWGKLVPPV